MRRKTKAVPMGKRHKHQFVWTRQYGIEPRDWVWECCCGAVQYGWDMYE